MEEDMRTTTLKKQLIQDIETLPEVKIREVMNFVDYLKLKEDEWFIAYVNKRGESAKTAKKSGKKFISLEELQTEYT
jgi:hypothetical protein